MGKKLVLDEMKGLREVAPNDLEGHYALLKRLEDQGQRTVEFPIHWLKDLLAEIEALRKEQDRKCS